MCWGSVGTVNEFCSGGSSSPFLPPLTFICNSIKSQSDTFHFLFTSGQNHIKILLVSSTEGCCRLACACVEKLQKWRQEMESVILDSFKLWCKATEQWKLVTWTLVTGSLKSLKIHISHLKFVLFMKMHRYAQRKERGNMRMRRGERFEKRRARKQGKSGGVWVWVWAGVC